MTEHKSGEERLGTLRLQWESEGDVSRRDVLAAQLITDLEVALAEVEARRRCDAVAPDGSGILCDRPPNHDGPHVSWQSVEWRQR
jgi:hypothetical protein